MMTRERGRDTSPSSKKKCVLQRKRRWESVKVRKQHWEVELRKMKSEAKMGRIDN